MFRIGGYKKGDQMKTAVIYARYSCYGQTEQSIEGQVRECQEYASHNDILIIDQYPIAARTVRGSL